MPVIEHDGWRIDFTDDGAGPPVILIHSSVSGNRQWRRLIADLKDDYRVLAINLFGYGETPPWPGDRPQTLEDQVGLVSGLVSALYGDETASIRVVGHSMGGAVAMKTAAMVGPRVEKLVLFEPNPFPLLAMEGRREAYGEAAALRDHVKSHGDRGEWTEAAPRFADYWLGEGNWAAMPPERQAGFAASMRPNYHEWDAVMGDTTPLADWENIAAQTLLMCAAETRRPTMEIVELLRGACPRWRYAEIADGGHMAPLIRPDLVNPVIEAFFGEAE